MTKRNIIILTLPILLFLALGVVLPSPSWAKDNTVSLKCWKCGTIFDADSSKTLVRCPNCNAKCMVPKTASSTSSEEETGSADDDQGNQDAAAAITWQEAMNRKGRTVVVEAKIVSVYDPDARGKKGPVKLNVDRNWRDSLTFVLFNRDGKFGNPSRFRNQVVRVRGVVGEYKGATQIKVERASDISIVKEPSPAQVSEVEPEKAPAIPETSTDEITAPDTPDSTDAIEEETAAATNSLTWKEALNHLGEEVTVEAVIVNVYDPASRGKSGPAKLNTDRDYRSSLTFVFYQKDRQGNDSGFGSPRQYLNKKVKVTGEVAEYKGAKQIMLRSPDQITILP